MQPATTKVKPFKIKSFTSNAIGLFAFKLFQTDPEMTNSVPDTTKWLSVLTTNSLFTTPNNEVEQKQARPMFPLTMTEHTHPPNSKHAGHKLVVKAYNGPRLAHQQN